MNIDLKSILNKLKPTSDKKSLRQIRAIQRQTTGVHRFASSHWLFAKIGLIVLVIVVSALQHLLYVRINKEAFDSTAEVQPIGTSNINAEKLFSVLTNERERMNEFASSIEKGPVSFDPSRYDVVLQKQVDEVADLSSTTSAASTEQ